MSAPTFNEDKQAWIKYGAQAELDFLNHLNANGGFNGVHVALNPNKATDPYTHDYVAGIKADLKTVRKPFFKAQEFYGIDPQYAITFNLKDSARYRTLYPNIAVIFDVLWEEPHTTKTLAGGDTRSVKPMHHVYIGFLDSVMGAIADAGNKIHAYLGRQYRNDGNAKYSWVFDARKLHRLV